MRKAVKIILVFMSVLLIGLIVLYFFRNPVVSYTLRKIIATESGQKIILTLEKVEFDPLDGSVSLYKPSLNFTDVYLNDKKAMKVNHLSFEKLGVYDVSVGDLLFDKRFIADRILVSKPSAQLEKIAGAKVDTSNVTPEKLIDLLNTNSKTFTSLKFNINEVEIRYGSINLQLDTVSEYIPDLLDFTLLLRGFETQSATNVPTENRILYSDEVILRVKNIYKQLKSGYDLSIDSVSYSSKSERFTTDGFLLLPILEGSEKKNKTQISISKINLDGIGVPEIRGLEKLHLSAFEISDVSVVQYKDEAIEVQSKNVADTNQVKTLPSFLNEVAFDSLIINRFSFLQILGGIDTTIAAENIELFIKDVAFDSTLLDNPMKHLQMGEVLFSTDMLELLETKKGISVAYSGFNYSSDEKQLGVNDIRVLSDSLVFEGPQFDVNLSALQISGFSVHEFLQKRKQILSVNLTQPIVNIDLDYQKADQEPASQKRNEYLELLDFQNFRIENGSLNLSNANKFNVGLVGINLLTDGIKIIYEDSIKQITYDTLRIELLGVDAVLEQGNGSVKTADVLFDGRNFEINDLQANYNRMLDNKSLNGTLRLQKFLVSEIDLNSLFFNQQFNAASIVLDAPAVSGSFPLPDSAKSNSDDQNKSKLPLSFQIGELRLQQGKVNVALEKPSDTIFIQTNLDLQMNELSSNDRTFVSWISPSDWKLKLSAVDIETNDYGLCANSFDLDAYKSVFVLQQLSLLGKTSLKNKTKHLKIEKVTLPEISISELNYKLLLENDSIRFGKLLVENPEIDLRMQHPETGTVSESNPAKFNLEKLFGIVYDTIDLNGLRLGFENSTDTTHALVEVGNFSIEHVSDRQRGANLMQEIAFQLEEVSVEDSINNTYLHLCELEFDPKSMALQIYNIDWSKINRDQNKNLAIHTSEIVFSGVYVKEALPSSIRFDKLKFSGLDVTVTDDEKNKSPRKKELEFNIQALKKYSGLLSRFAIDTTVFNEVSVHYRTFDGLQEHTIKADSIGLVVNRIDVDSSMFDQKNPVLIDNIIIDLKGRTRISKDSLYEMQTGRIHYNFPEHRITVDSFYVLPRYDEAECFRRAKYQKGIIKLFAEKLEFKDLRLDELVNKKQLHFGGIDVSGLEFNIVKDKKYPIKQGTYKPMPQDLIRGIDQKILVDSLRVIDSYLYFKLYPEKKTNQPGEIFLDKLNATAYNFTNIFSAADSATLKVSLNANIMGESRMDADFHFPLQDTANPWWFSFSTEKVDFSKLNSMTQHLVGLTIQRGKGTVNAPLIKGDNFNTTGTMVFRYKKVRLSLYNRKKAETETGVFSSMANFFINDLVIKSNNPKFARKPRVGQIYSERNTQKAIVNYAFQSILSGMLSTLGINKKEQRKERKEYKKEEKQNN